MKTLIYTALLSLSFSAFAQTRAQLVVEGMQAVLASKAIQAQITYEDGYGNLKSITHLVSGYDKVDLFEVAFEDYSQHIHQTCKLTALYDLNTKKVSFLATVKCEPVIERK